MDNPVIVMIFSLLAGFACGVGVAVLFDVLWSRFPPMDK